MEIENIFQVLIICRKFRKFESYNSIERKNFKNKYSNKNNLFLINIILFLLHKKISSGYIEIQVNKKGLNQILSDYYTGVYPSKIYINNIRKELEGKSINVESVSDIIRLEWNQGLSNFAYMFSNLISIIYVNINYIFAESYNINLAYMFQNCYNLSDFSYTINYKASHFINNIEGMFYNCRSLTSFSFDDFYLTKYYINNYHYNYLNMAYMFYNCQNLQEISYNKNHDYCRITKATRMFYNCYSLKSIDLEKFEFYDSNIDLSYMFYNCNKLETIIMPSSNSDFGIETMNQMFYKCESLKSISLRIYKKYTNYLDMSQLFYNCKSLESVFIDFGNLYVSNSKEMFYNCNSLKSIF